MFFVKNICKSNKKSFFCGFLFILFLCNSNVSIAQLYGGPLIGGELEQDGLLNKSSLGWEFGVIGHSIFGETIGITMDLGFRLIDVRSINYYDNEYKFLLDFYIGPALFLEVDDDFGIMINALMGYSTSAWIDDALHGNGAKYGSLSSKLSVDFVFNGYFIIGAFYRPMSQKIKSKDGIGFEIEPSFGIRIGYDTF